MNDRRNFPYSLNAGQVLMILAGVCGVLLFGAALIG